jgi:hypothetical protein
LARTKRTKDETPKEPSPAGRKLLKEVNDLEGRRQELLGELAGMLFSEGRSP